MLLVDPSERNLQLIPIRAILVVHCMVFEIVSTICNLVLFDVVMPPRYTDWCSLEVLLDKATS